LARFSPKLLEGKPFTVSEYNHPAPQDTQVECVPMMAAFAAAQDWDGVWFFAYSHRSGGLRDRFDSFFDIDANPSKMGFMPAGAAMFRRGGGGMPGVRTEWLANDDNADDTPSQRAAQLQATFDYMQPVLRHVNRQIEPLDELKYRQSVTFDLESAGFGIVAGFGGKTDNTQLTWQVTKGKGQFSLTGRFPGGSHDFSLMGGLDARAFVLVGHAKPPDTKPAYEEQKVAHLLKPAFGAIMMVSLDSKPLRYMGREEWSSRNILIAACGRCENVDMGFNADRTSVSSNWGKGPVQIEAVTAHVRLPNRGDMGDWTCHALRSDGSVGDAVPVEGNTVEISPNYKTMWYVLTR